MERDLGNGIWTVGGPNHEFFFALQTAAFAKRHPDLRIVSVAITNEGNENDVAEFRSIMLVTEPKVS